MHEENPYHISIITQLEITNSKKFKEKRLNQTIRSKCQTVFALIKYNSCQYLFMLLSSSVCNVYRLVRLRIQQMSDLFMLFE